MNEKTVQRLLECRLFRGFKKPELELLLEGAMINHRLYSSDRLVMFRGDSVDSLMILLEGRLQAQIQGVNGKVLRVEVLKPLEPVASGILFAQDNRLPVNLYAETDVELLLIPLDVVLKLCSANQDFLLYFLTDMGDKITVLAEKIRLFQFNTIRQKIAGYLLGLSGRRHINPVKLLYSKEVLSEIMGVTRPSLSREFSNLASEGIIETKGKTVRIIDRGRLEELLEE